MKRERLTNEELNQLGETLPGWSVENGSELTRPFGFGTYLQGIEFVQRLALVAEAMDHHPDLEVGWRRVRVRLSTHSAGGITELDVELARKAEAIFEGQS